MARQPVSKMFNLLVALVALVAAAISGTRALSTLLEVRTTERKVESDIERAKARVEAPKLPPKPAGKTETVTEKKFAEVEMPYMDCRGFRCTQHTKRVQMLVAEVPVQRFIGPTTEEIRQWEAEVADLNRKYQAQLQLELDRMEEKRAADEKARREEAKDWVTMWGMGIAALVAVANLFLAFLKDKREREARRDAERASAPEREKERGPSDQTRRSGERQRPDADPEDSLSG